MRVMKAKPGEVKQCGCYHDFAKAKAAEHLQILNAAGEPGALSKARFHHARAVALTLPLKPCQRPGCLNLDRMRLQQHYHTTGSLYLCDWCLDSLLPIYLNDGSELIGSLRMGFCLSGAN